MKTHIETIHKMKQEVATTNSEISEIAKSSGLPMIRAEEIASNYVPFMAEAQRLASVVKALKVGNPADVPIAKRARIDISKTCAALARQKKADKEHVISEGRYVDGLYNTVEHFLRELQPIALSVEEFEQRREAECKRKLAEERQAQLDLFGVTLDNLGDMAEQVWLNFLEGTKVSYEIKLQAEAKAKAEAEAAAEAERKRIAEQAAENARLKAEAEAREAEIAKEREAQVKALAEANAKAEAARKEAEEKAAKIRAEIEAKAAAERAEAARVAAELQAKKDAEAKAEAERMANIEAERKEAERLAKEPVKKQLTVWIESMQINPSPVDNPTAREIEAKFNSFKTWAKQQINNI